MTNSIINYFLRGNLSDRSEMVLVCSTISAECLFFKDISKMINTMGGGIAVSIQASIEKDFMMVTVFYQVVIHTMRDISIKDSLAGKVYILVDNK